MLKSLLATLLLILPLSLVAQTAKPAPATATAAPPQVVLHTSQGDIALELYPDKAPKSVANFLQYVRDGFYDGTLLHRAIPLLMIRSVLQNKGVLSNNRRKQLM